MTCKRCGETIIPSDSCGDYGCVHCCDGMTYNIEKRQSYIAALYGVYDSRTDCDGGYDAIWPQSSNEPKKVLDHAV